METKTEKVITIRIPEDEINKLHAELKSVEFTDGEQPLMYKIWRELGAAR